MKIKSLFLFLFSPLILFACLFLSKPAYAANYQLSGKVTDNSSTAIVDATIDIYNQGTTTDVVSPITTDSSGNYIFSSVPQGTYDIKVTPPSGSNFSSAIALSQNISTNTTLNFILLSAGTVTLSGHVYDSLGIPVPGVNAKISAGNTQVASTTTDSSGSYSMTVSTGTYTISYIGGGGTPNLPPFFSLDEGNYSLTQSTVLDITIPVNKIQIHIQDSTGTPVGNVKLVDDNTAHVYGWHYQNQFGGLSIGGGITDAAGSTSYYPNGTYTDSSGSATLWLVPGTYTPYKFTATPPSGSIFNTFPFTFNVNGDSSYIFSLQYIHATPVTTASLSTQNTDGTYSDPTTVTLSATFANSLTGTTYYEVDPTGSTTPQIYSTPFNVTGSGQHTIKYWSVDSQGIPESPNTKTFTTEDLYSLSGTVFVDSNQNGFQDSGELGYQGATITLNTGQTATSDSSGNYTISSLIAGTYVESIVVPGGFNSTTTNPVTVVISSDTTQNFGIAPVPTNTPTPIPTNTPTPTPTNTPTPTFTPTPTPIPTYSVSGTVYNDDNQNGFQDNGEGGYSGATITLNTGQTATSDSNGNYTISDLIAGTYTETLRVPNGYSATTTNPVTVPVNSDTTQNFGIYSQPVVGAVTVSPNPVQINNLVTATATYTDADTTDTHTATVNWGDTTTSCNIIEPSGSTPGTVTCNRPSGYTTANIYSVTITVLDNDGAQGQSTNPYVSVYAPTTSGKFSAGEGYVTPTTAYAQDSTLLTSSVSFGLVYKYQGTMPTGDKQFTMSFGNSNITFSAASVTSLVLSNGIGTLTGTGTFSNSSTVYNFLIVGDQNNNTIRIQITDPTNNNAIIYDTQNGASQTADPSTHVTGPNGKGNGHVIAG